MNKEIANKILKAQKNSQQFPIDAYLSEDGYVWQMILKAMDEYAKIKMIEENKSLLEMAKLHMDSRAVLVISERISELEK
jgi:hypothetical protein